MYSGIDGRMLEVKVYQGIMYYQRLKHMTEDKYQVPALSYLLLLWCSVYLFWTGVGGVNLQDSLPIFWIVWLVCVPNSAISAAGTN